MRVRGILAAAACALLPCAGVPAAAATTATRTDPARGPAWRILVLVYPTTVVLRDGHTYIGTMDPGERERSIANARRFVREDIPRLDSGRMVPELAVREVARPLNLSPEGEDGWHPDPADTTPERDPAFDSVIVIWDQSAIDTALRPKRLHHFAGLTWPTGLGQTYSAIPAEYAAHNDPNVFKHEWGHAILFFHDALGVAPRPAVDNHGPAGRYVHCTGGAAYTWEDEHDPAPIPNSTYNDDSGFTHDYYSGTIALADAPDTCLGVTPAAWAAGGPLSNLIKRQVTDGQRNARTATARAPRTTTASTTTRQTTAQT